MLNNLYQTYLQSGNTHTEHNKGLPGNRVISPIYGIFGAKMVLLRPILGEISKFSKAKNRPCHVLIGVILENHEVNFLRTFICI